MASKIGGLKHYNIDAKEEFANEYIARNQSKRRIRRIPIKSALARPLIAQKIIEVAEKKEQQQLHTDVLEKEMTSSDLKQSFLQCQIWTSLHQSEK